MHIRVAKNSLAFALDSTVLLDLGQGSVCIGCVPLNQSAVFYPKRIFFFFAMYFFLQKSTFSRNISLLFDMIFLEMQTSFVYFFSFVYIQKMLILLILFHLSISQYVKPKTPQKEPLRNPGAAFRYSCQMVSGGLASSPMSSSSSASIASSMPFSPASI